MSGVLPVRVFACGRTMNHCWPLGLYHIKLSFTFLLCDVWSSGVYNPDLKQPDQFTSHISWKEVKTKRKEKTDRHKQMFNSYNKRQGILVNPIVLVFTTIPFKASSIRYTLVIVSYRKCFSILSKLFHFLSLFHSFALLLAIFESNNASHVVQTPPKIMFHHGQLYKATVN